MILEVTKKNKALQSFQAVYFLKYILRVNPNLGVGVFLLVFSE